MSAGGRRLPMVGRPQEAERLAAIDEVEGSGSTKPDPARIAAGWEHRFVAAGARAQEMITLYREVGYEVAADPVFTHGLEDGCVACFASGGEQYWSIYTRRGSAPAASPAAPGDADARTAWRRTGRRPGHG